MPFGGARVNPIVQTSPHFQTLKFYKRVAVIVSQKSFTQLTEFFLTMMKTFEGHP